MFQNHPNYIKSLTGLSVEGSRRVCIAGLPIEEGRPTAPRQRIRSEWRWVGNGPNEWSSRSSSWGNGPTVLFVDRQHLWSNILPKDLWNISQFKPVQYKAKRLNARLVIKSDFFNLCMYKCIIVRKKMALLWNIPAVDGRHISHGRDCTLSKRGGGSD